MDFGLKKLACAYGLLLFANLLPQIESAATGHMLSSVETSDAFLSDYSDCNLSPRQCQEAYDMSHNVFHEQCYLYDNNVHERMEPRACATVCREDLPSFNHFQCSFYENCQEFKPQKRFCDEEFTSSVSSTTSRPLPINSNPSTTMKEDSSTHAMEESSSHSTSYKCNSNSLAILGVLVITVLR